MYADWMDVKKTEEWKTREDKACFYVLETLGSPTTLPLNVYDHTIDNYILCLQLNILCISVVLVSNVGVFLVWSTCALWWYDFLSTYCKMSFGSGPSYNEFRQMCIVATCIFIENSEFCKEKQGKHRHEQCLGSFWARSVFKIEVFDALQTRFGPSKYTSLKTDLSKRNSKLKMKTWLEVLNIIYPPQNPIIVGVCQVLQEVEIDGWFFILHVTSKTCTIIINAQV